MFDLFIYWIIIYVDLNYIVLFQRTLLKLMGSRFLEATVIDSGKV